ncbi:hypothetical protein GCM10029978_064400 [Actinoallomurus acanthiterrae]
MLRITRSAAVFSAVAAAGLAAAAAPASAGTTTSGHPLGAAAVAKLPKPKYYASGRCVWHGKTGNRWASGYIKTDGKPTKVGQIADIVEWGYAFEWRHNGNHKNSAATAWTAKRQLAGSAWRLSGGPGLTGHNAIEDSKYHKGKLYHIAAIGYPTNGELAVVFWMDFDKTDHQCTIMIRASNLRRL